MQVDCLSWPVEIGRMEIRKMEIGRRGTLNTRIHLQGYVGEKLAQQIFAFAWSIKCLRISLTVSRESLSFSLYPQIFNI